MNIQTKDGTVYEFAPTSNKKQIRANYLLVCEQSRHNKLQKARREIAEGNKRLNGFNDANRYTLLHPYWFKP